MPRKCYIPGCDSNSNKSSKYTPIFSFPKEKNRRKIWVDAVKQQFPHIFDQDPGVNASVCIHHFELDLVEKVVPLKKNFESSGEAKAKLKLKKEAIPTIWTTDNDKRPVPKISRLKQRTRRLATEAKQLQKLLDKKEPRIIFFKKPAKQPSNPISTQSNKFRDEAIRLSVVQHYIKDYGPQYHETPWNKNCRVLKKSTNHEENPLNWTITQVSNYVGSVCANPDIGALFLEQEVDGSAFLDLTKDDLLQLLGIKLGPAIKISTLIQKLRTEICEKFIVCESEGLIA